MHHQYPEESELVELAKTDTSVAFDALCELYMPVLQNRAGRYSNIIGIETEDFIQEGMFALYRAVKTFDPKTGIQFRTYAITCINNSMITAMKNHMRSLKQQVAICFDEMDESTLLQQASQYPEDMLVEDIYIQMETTNYRLRQMEDLLSDFERHVFKLYLSGYTYQQIANVLSTTTKPVDNALQRVRRKLRPEL